MSIQYHFKDVEAVAAAVQALQLQQALQGNDPAASVAQYQAELARVVVLAMEQLAKVGRARYIFTDGLDREMAGSRAWGDIAQSLVNLAERKQNGQA